MLGDDEIFSSSVRALLHLSLQKRCHCQPDDARTRTSTQPTAATLRLNRSGDPLASGRHFAVLVSVTQIPFAFRAPGEHNSHEEQGNRWNSIQGRV